MTFLFSYRFCYADDSKNLNLNQSQGSLTGQKFSSNVCPSTSTTKTTNTPPTAQVKPLAAPQFDPLSDDD